MKCSAVFQSSRLDTVQQNIRENQNIIAEWQEAKIKHVLSDGYKYKKRGNEEQHKHNVKVMSKLNWRAERWQSSRGQAKIAEGLGLQKSVKKLAHVHGVHSGSVIWKIYVQDFRIIYY